MGSPVRWLARLSSAFSWRCFDSCAATAFSTILDRKWRFDTGLKFLRSSGLREGFLRRGVTCATLSGAGTTPDVSERFTMLLIAGRSTSICSMRSEVGMGSNAHDLAGDRRMILRSSSGVTGKNCVRSLCLGFTGISGREWTVMSSRCLQMSTIFLWKKLQKRLARCCAEVCSGSRVGFLRCSSLSTALKRARGHGASLMAEEKNCGA